MSLEVVVDSSSKNMGLDENKEGGDGTEVPKAHAASADVSGEKITRGMSEVSLAATEEEEEEETEGKIDLGPQCSLKEQLEKDKDDESLRKWKEQLLGSVDLTSIGEALEPEVKILTLTIKSAGRDDIVLPIPEDGKVHGNWFTLKEDCPYHLQFVFQVSNNIVSGLKYTNTVWKTGMKGNN
ncbi:Rab GDP dissociation inhibitor alpha [Dionaea muscipula]